MKLAIVFLVIFLSGCTSPSRLARPEVMDLLLVVMRAAEHHATEGRPGHGRMLIDIESVAGSASESSVQTITSGDVRRLIARTGYRACPSHEKTSCVPPNGGFLLTLEGLRGGPEGARAHVTTSLSRDGRLDERP
ncbi:MAG: hypothetical protein KY444_11070 [Gemmatimonadetes bacterium]|nr:hypothetical protein [Gemmatimonadota bacterium]